jgi:hypothetical protein
MSFLLAPRSFTVSAWLVEKLTRQPRPTPTQQEPLLFASRESAAVWIAEHYDLTRWTTDSDSITQELVDLAYQHRDKTSAQLRQIVNCWIRCSA